MCARPRSGCRFFLDEGENEERIEASKTTERICGTFALNKQGNLVVFSRKFVSHVRDVPGLFSFVLESRQADASERKIVQTRVPSIYSCPYSDTREDTVSPMAPGRIYALYVHWYAFACRRSNLGASSGGRNGQATVLFLCYRKPRKHALRLCNRASVTLRLSVSRGESGGRREVARRQKKKRRSTRRKTEGTGRERESRGNC